MTMKLTATNVKATIMACLYDDTDVIDGKLRDGAPEPIKVHSVMLNAGFNSVKVKAQTENIKAMLNELSLDFFPVDQGGGGGMSFLQLCVTRDGEQWGEHRNCDELMALGMAAGFCTFLMERDLWRALPGGMPYISVNTSAVAEKLAA